MAEWVTEQLRELLFRINEVPYTDMREEQQLTILMHGFSQLNNQAMDKAATKTRKQMRGWSLDGAMEEDKEKKKQAALKKLEDATAEELTRLRPLKR